MTVALCLLDSSRRATKVVRWWRFDTSKSDRCKRKISISFLAVALIALVGVIVPWRRLRVDWRQEWESELRYREGAPR